MTEFSVNTRNRFALGLDDEDDLDPHEVLKNKEEEKEKQIKATEEAKRKAAEKAKKDKRINNTKNSIKKFANKSSQNSTNIQTNQSRDNVPVKSSSYPRNDENRPPRLRNNQGRPNANNENMNFEKPPQDNRERRDGPGNFRGRGRGTRGFGGRGRREFERHSGSDKTGVKAVEKRDGFGSHNWGDEISSQLEQSSLEGGHAEQTSEPTTGEEAAEKESPTKETSEEEKTEQAIDGEKQTMTYEEYLAKNTRAKPVFENTRKANEGVDTKQWRKTVPLERKVKGDHSDEEYELYDEEMEDVTKSNLEKLNIQITFGDRRGRGGRGRGFGGPRGRGGFDSRGDAGFNSRGGFEKRGGRTKHHVPEIDNENFPTLGSR